MSKTRTVQERLRAYRELCKNDSKVWSPSTVWRHFDEAADRIDALEKALGEIAQWSEAYPETVFSEPNFGDAAGALGCVGISLDQLHGSWGRHLTSGIGNIARAALHPSDHIDAQAGGVGIK